MISSDLKAAIFDYGGVMAKSPVGRVEKLADYFGADKEMIMGLILGQNSADDNPWFDAECGRQPLNENFGQRMQKIFNSHNLVFDQLMDLLLRSFPPSLLWSLSLHDN